jgi:hypothetical protein
MFKPLLRRVSLALLLVASLASADVIDLKLGHPVDYVVKEGDTLWGISQKFLDDAWLWPEIWQINEQIGNPHLIYPGDIIGLVYLGKQVKITIKKRALVVAPKELGPIILLPSARISEITSAIPPIPMSAISSFMVNSRIVKGKALKEAPYVVAGDDNRLLAGGGGKVYARGFKKEEPQKSYGLFRKGQIFVDPDTSEVLGMEAKEVAAAKVTRWDGDIATLKLASSREEVMVGDRLLSTDERLVVANYMPSAPKEDVFGRMIAVLGGVTQIGQYNVVVINQGKRDGVTEGNVLAIYKEGSVIIDRVTRSKVKLPAERAGLLMLFRVFDKVSYGLVLRSKVPLSVGDAVRNP